MPRLTDTTVQRLAPPSRIIWDSDVKGFGCRLSSGGAKSFVVDYRRRADGMQRRTPSAHSPTGPLQPRASRPNG
jgi:hypothetical protein